MSGNTNTPEHHHRNGGNIIGSTLFKSKYTEEMEERWCKCISEGIPVKPTWGSDWVIEHWQEGKKHDPTNEHSRAIRTLIRISGEKGISKTQIITVVGGTRPGSSQETGPMLCELDKMGLFK